MSRLDYTGLDSASRQESRAEEISQRWASKIFDEWRWTTTNSQKTQHNTQTDRHAIASSANYVYK